MGAGFNRTVRKLTAALDLPADVVLDLPRITVIGNSEMLIEKHKGIERYTPEEIQLRVKDGVIRVYGRKLAVRFIEKDDIKIEGSIFTIEMVNQ
jgi:sporulation protein YqfC